MWLVSLRDLQWRRRRFAIGVLAAALVFAMTLLMAGMSGAFRVEADRTVAGFAADAWVIRDGAVGPFSAPPLPAQLVAAVAAQPGVTRADPVAVLRQVVGGPDDPLDVNVIGALPGGLGAPTVATGRAPQRRGEAVVDRSLGAVGDRLEMGGRTFDVVGVVDATYFAGVPVVHVPLEDAQAIGYDGQPLVTAIVTSGEPAAAPPGTAVVGNAAVRADLLRPLISATQTIDMVQLLLWVLAACIIGSIIYLSALERSRDFAVFKATGTGTGELAAGLALQAVVLSLAAAALSTLFAMALAPRFPLPVAIPTRAVLLLPVMAVLIGLLASLVGLQRTVRADPALAFRGP